MVSTKFLLSDGCVEILESSGKQLLSNVVSVGRKNGIAKDLKSTTVFLNQRSTFRLKSSCAKNGIVKGTFIFGDCSVSKL